MQWCFIIPSLYRNKTPEVTEGTFATGTGYNLVFGTLMVLSQNVYLSRVQKKPHLGSRDREWLMPSLWYASPQLPFWESEQLWYSFFKMGKHACVSELLKIMTYKGKLLQIWQHICTRNRCGWLGQTLRIFFSLEWEPPIWQSNDDTMDAHH